MSSFALLAKRVRADAARAAAGDDEDTPAVEDLMREHGVLRRVLLIYEEILRRLGAGESFPPSALKGALEIVARFIEGYHEPMEEEHLFPRFREPEDVAMVKVLIRQHRAGKRLTERLVGLLPARSSVARFQLAAGMRAAIRMYRPHASQEDTVLFPRFRRLVTASEYAAIGEEFEKSERATFGPRGFEGIVDEVADLECRVGLGDLASVTAR